MSFVVDASVSACWLLPDETDTIASSVRARLDHEDARAPAIWWFEIRNVLLLAERKKRLTSDQAMAALTLLQTLPIWCEPIPEPFPIERLARRHRLTFYDAAYLELVLRERLPLATLDRDLRAAARGEGVPLVGA